MDEVIGAGMPEVQGYFEAGRAERPDLEGKVVVKLIVGSDGHVTGAKVKSTTLAAPTVEGCIVDHIGRLTFDPPKGGGIAIASFPFHAP